MAPPLIDSRPSWRAKLLLCFLAGLVAGATLLRVGRWVIGPWAPYASLLAGAVLVLLSAIGYGIYWGRQPVGRPMGRCRLFGKD